MRKSRIEKILEILSDRNESDQYIIDYLTDIISGLEEVEPKKVKKYLDITIHNMYKTK